MNLYDALHNLMKASTSSVGLWKVLTALRGCDLCGNDTSYFLKRYTTARLRAIFYQCNEEERIIWESFTGTMINPQPLTKEMIATRNYLLANASIHFKGHFTDGMIELKKAGYRIPDEEMDFSYIQETEE